MVLLSSWLVPSPLTVRGQLDVVDLFAGEGRIARLGRATGQHALALDLLYSSNTRCFDINEEPGFLFLDHFHRKVLLN